MKKPFFFMVLLLSCLCFGQENSKWQEVLDSKLSFEQKRNTIDSLIIQYQTKNKDSVLERLTHKYAVWLYQKKHINLAIDMAEKSLLIKKKHFSKDTTLLQHGLNNLAFFYLKNKNYLKSIVHYQELITLNSNSNFATGAYSGLGRCYTAIGDYHKAKTHFELAHSLLKKSNNQSRIITNAINATDVYIKLGTPDTYKQGIQMLLLADSLSNTIPSKTSTKFNIKLNLGNLYNQHETINPEKAFYYYDQILNLAKYDNDSLEIAKAYSLIGNVYNTIDPDQSIKYQKTAINYAQDDSIQHSIIYSNIAYCLLQKTQFSESIINYKKSISLLTGKSIPNKTLFQKITNTAYLLADLKNLAGAYLNQFKATRESNYLKQSITTFLLADQLIDLFRIESQEFQSKLFWRKQSSELYGKAIEACFLAQDETNAFYFMEKNKALLLTEGLINSKIKQSLQLPKDLVDHEIQLQKNIYFLEQELKKTTNEEKLNTTKIKLLTQKKELKTAQDSIKKRFSKYQNFEFQSPVTMLKSVQESLDENTFIVEYNISEYTEYGLSTNLGYIPVIPEIKHGVKKTHKVYLLCITKNEHYFIELPNPDQLKSDTQKLIKKASLPFKNKEDIVTYHKIGYRVFDQLFPTKEIKALIQDKKVRIIPDSYLNYLPFEALVTNPIQTDRLQYLIEDSEISYAYSNSFLTNASDRKITDTISFIGFAPANFEKYNLIPLENSATEITNIKKYFDGKIITDHNASKKHFLNTLKDHTIIHLATHADAIDSITPWVAFSDEKIILDELYLTKNNADLVVLSGCNTLKGKQETGEGVMSLARGFFHSGAKSVVSSLWNVDDRSTSYIMDQFYKNLKNNQSKSKALRDAKLSYLKNSSLSESSPHFWASFVLLGDSSPIKTSSFLYKYWLVFLIPLLLIFLIIYRKMKK